MKGYSAGNKIIEYALLVATGFTCVYGLCTPVVPSPVMNANILPVLTCNAVLLFLPCFLKRLAKIIGILVAAAVILFTLIQILTKNATALPTLAARVPGLFLFRGDDIHTFLLCGGCMAAAAAVFLCRKSRLGLTMFWAVNAAVPSVLVLTGSEVSLSALLGITGCCAVLFVRRSVQPALANNPDGPRLSLRITAVASIILVVLLVSTQLGFTALNAKFGSTPKLNIADLTARVQSIFFTTSGFGNYNPNELLGRRIRMDNTLMLEVQADGPFYLRGRIYDTYTGKSWRAATSDDNYRYRQSLSLLQGYSNGGIFSSGGYAVPVPGSFPRTALLLRVHSITITTKTEGQKYLFLPGTSLGDSRNLLFGGIPLRHVYPDLEAAQPLPSGTSYALTYFLPDLQNEAFQSAIQKEDDWLQNGSENPANHAVQFLFGSTEGLTDRTLTLAKSITENCTNEFQKAEAIESWLRSNCAYTLSPPQPWGNRDFVDYFLFQSRKGYCEHFATAMTMLLRASGVPARYVRGYASPSVSESGLYEVTNAQAHAWVEYYSPLYGFITADPTPSSALPETFTREQAQEGEPSSSPGSSSAASELPSSSTPSSSPESSSGFSLSPSASSGGSAPENRAGPGIPYSLAIAGIILLLLFSLYGGKAAYRALWFAVVLRRDDRTLVLSLYGYFAAVLMRLGFELPRSGTPRELADLVRDKLQFGAVSFDRVTQLYVEVRYGERTLTEGERDELIAFYKTLPEVCRKRLGRLRYFLIYPILH